MGDLLFTIGLREGPLSFPRTASIARGREERVLCEVFW